VEASRRGLASATSGVQWNGRRLVMSRSAVRVRSPALRISAILQGKLGRVRACPAGVGRHLLQPHCNPTKRSRPAPLSRADEVPRSGCRRGHGTVAGESYVEGSLGTADNRRKILLGQGVLKSSSTRSQRPGRPAYTRSAGRARHLGSAQGRAPSTPFILRPLHTEGCWRWVCK
jgi:hypothetical protein